MPCSLGAGLPVWPAAPQGGAQHTSCEIRGRASLLSFPFPKSPVWPLRLQLCAWGLGLASILSLCFPHGARKGLDENLWKALWVKFQTLKGLAGPTDHPLQPGTPFPGPRPWQAGLGSLLQAPPHGLGVDSHLWCQYWEGSVAMGSLEVDSIALQVRACPARG